MGLRLGTKKKAEPKEKANATVEQPATKAADDRLAKPKRIPLGHEGLPLPPAPTPPRRTVFNAASEAKERKLACLCRPHS